MSERPAAPKIIRGIREFAQLSCVYRHAIVMVFRFVTRWKERTFRTLLFSVPMSLTQQEFDA